MPVVMRIIIYPLFAILTFLIFFVMLFPIESVKTRMELEAERSLGGDYDVQIQDLSMAPISGVSLDNVTVRKRGADQEPVLKLDEADLHFDIMPLLWGSLRVAFDMDVGKSKMTGKIARDGSDIQVKFDATKFNIADFPILKQLYGVDLSSDIDADIDMEIFPTTPLKNNGSIVLNIKALKMGESNIMNVFPLPAMTLAEASGKSSVDMVMNRGNIEIRKMDLRGGDLDLGMDGKVFLAQRVANFRLNLKGKFGFSERLAKELPALAIISQQQGEDGLYPISVTGRLNQPSIKVGDFKVPL